jgi:hypothetical protein
MSETAGYPLDKLSPHAKVRRAILATEGLHASCEYGGKLSVPESPSCVCGSDMIECRVRGDRTIFAIWRPEGRVQCGRRARGSESEDRNIEARADRFIDLSPDPYDLDHWTNLEEDLRCSPRELF